VFALVVIRALKTQGVFVEIGEQVVDAGFTVDGEGVTELVELALLATSFAPLRAGKCALERFQALTAHRHRQVRHA